MRRGYVLQAMLDQSDDHARRSSRTANARRCRSRRTCGCPARDGPAPVLRQLRQAAADRRVRRRREVFGGGLEGARRRSTSSSSSTARDAISKWLHEPERARRRRSSRSTRATARCARWSAATNYRKSQFNLAVQGERQPGSSFKPFVLATALREGSRPRRTSSRSRRRSTLGDTDLGTSTTTTTPTSARSTSTTATIDSDNAVYAQLTQLVGPKSVAETAQALGIRSKLDALLRDRPRRRGGEPARAWPAPTRRFANGGRRVDGAMFGNKPRVIEQVTRAGPHAIQRADGVRRADRDRRPGSCNVDPAEGRPARHRQARRTRRTGRWPARPARPRTTATRGSSATRRSSSSPSGSATRRRCRPMLTEFHGDAVAGGTLPGADLEVVQWRRRCKGVPPEGFPTRRPPYVAPKLVVRRGDRLMLDNGLCRSRQEVVYFAGKGPTKTANCLAERGRGAGRRAS